jgi:shikimate kinase
MTRQGDKETRRQGDKETDQGSSLLVSLSPCLLVFLIGPRGSGKTTVARLLAERLGWDGLDADAELERHCGKCIREVFADEGEAGFRRHEADVLAELCERRNVVIATGGGVVLREENRRRLKAGRVVWLTADADTLWRRVQSDTTTAERRPGLFAGVDGRREIEQVLEAREPHYRECADFVVDTTARSPEEIVALILSSLTTTH